MINNNVELEMIEPDGEQDQNKDFNFEDGLNAAGFGKFQLQLLVVCGVGYLALTMELISISFLLPELHKQWTNLSSLQSSLLVSGIFAGSLVGSLFWGAISDRIGRKPCFVATVILSTLFGIGTALAPNFWVILVCRIIVGFALGGNAAVDFVLFLEFIPSSMKRRGMQMTWIILFGVFGVLFTAGGAWVIIPRSGWRWYMIYCTVPTASVLLFRAWTPESPRYLLISNKTLEAQQVLELVARKNNKNLPQGKLQPLSEISKNERGKFKDLLTPSLRTTSFLLWIFASCIRFAYYGITTWLPIYLSTKNLANDLYENFFFMGLAEIPGVFLAAYVIDKIGRKKSLSICMIGCSISTILFCFATSRITVKIFSMSIFFFVVGAWAVIDIYTPEVYPTSLRSTATGFMAVFGAFGGITSPLAGGIVIDNFSNDIALYIALGMYSFAFLLGGIIAMLLPYETKQKKLDDTVEHVNIDTEKVNLLISSQE